MEYVIQENTISECHVQFIVTCHFFVMFTRKVSENYSKSFVQALYSVFAQDLIMGACLYLVTNLMLVRQGKARHDKSSLFVMTHGGNLVSLSPATQKTCGR